MNQLLPIIRRKRRSLWPDDSVVNELPTAPLTPVVTVDPAPSSPPIEAKPKRHATRARQTAAR